jgi:hypothetical protein
MQDCELYMSICAWWCPVTGYQSCDGRTANNSVNSVCLLSGCHPCLPMREYQLNVQLRSKVRSNFTFTSVSTHSLISSVCGDVTQRALVFTDVSGQPIGSFLKGGMLLSQLPDNGQKRPKHVVVEDRWMYNFLKLWNLRSSGRSRNVWW